MTTHFVAFGRDPGLPGQYERQSMTAFGIRRFCRNDGEGFWSLVRGQHAVLVAMEYVGTTVVNKDFPLPGSEAPPEPGIGDQVLVIVPEEYFIVFPDDAVDDHERTELVPIPACTFELWTRTG